MFKSNKLIIINELVYLFNNVMSSSLYPSTWNNSILTLLLKSGELSDTNNFQGVAVSFFLGKLFNTLLNTRLENKCVKEGIVNYCQGSSKKGSRLLIIYWLLGFSLTSMLRFQETNYLLASLISVKHMTPYQEIF